MPKIEAMDISGERDNQSTLDSTCGGSKRPFHSDTYDDQNNKRMKVNDSSNVDERRPPRDDKHWHRPHQHGYNYHGNNNHGNSDRGNNIRGRNYRGGRNHSFHNNSRPDGPQYQNRYDNSHDNNSRPQPNQGTWSSQGRHPTEQFNPEFHPHQPSSQYQFATTTQTPNNFSQPNFDRQSSSFSGRPPRGYRHSAIGGPSPAGRESAADIFLSKTMAFLLRHGAVKARIPIQSDGYIYVVDLLRHRDLRSYTEPDVERVVKNNNKQRFQITTDGPTGKLKVADLQLELITSTFAASLESVVHGTYLESLTEILKTGLSRMGRNHIHFTTAEPEFKRVTSGMRSSCEVVIYIDINSAIKDGFEFFKSANNVILCPGDDQGILPKKYFSRIVQRNPREEIAFK